jgi:hypothetical protein
MTTEEPHGVCCLEGLKVSMGMHNFGEKRWSNGIVDDVRSLNDFNTRLVGDFIKNVRTPSIIDRMLLIMTTDDDWSEFFDQIIKDSAFAQLSYTDPVVPKIVNACEWLAENAKKFRRQSLQTRFFETGDNFYLGMELYVFPR